jgi:hypothetical protein
MKDNLNMKKKFKCVCVYTGYGENSINSVWEVEGNSKEEVIESEFKKCVEELKESNKELGDDVLLEFYGIMKWGYGCGEEDCVVVVEEGEEMFEILDKDSDGWSKKEWKGWDKFMNEVGV